MMDSRFSPRGSAVRALILVLGCVALIWIGYLLLLPPALQAAEVETFVRVIAGLGIVGVVVAISNRPAPKTRTFWLSQDGESEPCGPYTVAQLVAMWKAGQITTRGTVAEEGSERWIPIMDFADRFDASVPEKSSREPLSLARAVGIALAVLIVLALLSHDWSGSRGRSDRGTGSRLQTR